MKSIFAELNPNQKEVLNLIRIHKELSGATIARITNLQPSTIVYILKALTEYNLIEFSKTGESTTKGGKKPTLYKINADVGYIIGLEILLHKIKLTVIDFAGNKVVMQEEDYPQGLKGDRLINETETLVKQFMKRPGFEMKKIMGIGIGIPGIVNSRKGIVNYSRKLELENFALKEKIEQRLGISTFIGNDANAGVLGFKWFPEKDQFANVIYLTYNQESTTIGTGILINGVLYEGISGGAGEILSNLPALHDLIDKTNQTSGEKLHPSLSLDETIGKMRSGSGAAIHVVETLCQKLADEIVSIIAFMNPNAIIIGGDLAEYTSLVEEKIEPYVKNRIHASLKHGFEVPVIKASQFGIFSVSLGAAALVLNEYFIAGENK